MVDTTDAVGRIIDAANHTLRALDLIEGCMLIVINDAGERTGVKHYQHVLDHVARARREQLDIKALF